jgi:ferritin-like metal-binding protein YciE
MKTKVLRDFFHDELKDIYDAEHRLLRALPKMAKAASSEELQNAFNDHLEKTRTHVERLDQVFRIADMKPARKNCDGMKGLLEEGQSLMEKEADESAMDAGLIGAAQRVEHYEMAAYGTLKAWAEVLGLDEAAGLLEETLEEEKEADETLNSLAEGGINQAAAQGGEEEDAEDELADDDAEDEVVGTGTRQRSASNSSRASKSGQRRGNKTTSKTRR